MDAPEAPTDSAESPEREHVDPAPDPALIVPPPPAEPGEVPLLAEPLAPQTGRSLAIVGALALAGAVLLVALVLLAVDDETTISTTTTTTTTTPIQSAPAIPTGGPDLEAAAVVDRIRPAQKAVNGNLRTIRLTPTRLVQLRDAALNLANAVADARGMLPTVANSGHRETLRVALSAEHTFVAALLALPVQPGLVTPRRARSVRDAATRARGLWSRVAAIDGVTMLPIGPAWEFPLVSLAEDAARVRRAGALAGSAAPGTIASFQARATARARAAAASAAAAAAGTPAPSATGTLPPGTATGTISSPTHASHCRFYPSIPYSTGGESGVVCTTNSGPKAGYAALLTASGSTWLGLTARRWSLDGGPVLPYGSATSMYGITCSSSLTALSCSSSESGITLAKESHSSW